MDPTFAREFLRQIREGYRELSEYALRTDKLLKREVVKVPTSVTVTVLRTEAERIESYYLRRLQELQQRVGLPCAQLKKGVMCDDERAEARSKLSECFGATEHLLSFCLCNFSAISLWSSFSKFSAKMSTTCGTMKR